MKSISTPLANRLAALAPVRDTMVTIGVFDGVHLGHQSLIDTLKRRAAEYHLLSAAITFECHPEEVLVPGCRLPWLTDITERLDLIRGLGVGLVAAIPFDAEVAGLDARQFLALLKEHLKMKGLVIGPDFALGKGRQGDLSALSAIGKEMGIMVEAVPPLVLDGAVVSSTEVRRAVSGGDVTKYRRLVGRSFTLRGNVIRGAERGRKLGFPTANLAIDPTRAIPANGIYASWADIAGARYSSATNLGVRPTFDDGERLAEVHILDFNEDIYGKEIAVELVKRLRDEKKFGGVDELIEQMKRDVADSRDALAEAGR